MTDDRESTLDELNTNYVGRTLATGSIVASWVGRRALRSLQRVVAPATADEREQADWERLVASFGSAKGLLLKVGQLASYMNFDLPESTRQALSTLQESSRAFDARAIGLVIERELGRPPSELFANWESTPFAAASIGQVHRARHRDGRALAVKVQYPEIERAVESDLRNTAALTTVTGLLFRGFDKKSALSELRARFLEECDYLLEARNQEDFRIRFDGRHRIPAVVPELSSRRVLTSELVEGLRFSEFIGTASQAMKNAAGRAMLSFAFESILRHHVFNCDPHPGNYRFVDGEVVFLDFGSVKHFDERFVGLWRSMLQAVAQENRPRFRDAVVELGIVPRDADFDFAHQYEIARYLSRPWTERGRFRFTKAYVRGTLPLLLSANPNKSHMNVPPDLLFLNRLQWGLYAVLADMEAESDWGAQLEPLLFSESNTSDARGS